jgi:hypothetical protein
MIRDTPNDKKQIPPLTSISSEAEIFKQKLEREQKDKTTDQDVAIPAVQPLALDGIHSQQQFYDAIWGTLGDLNGWLETMEISLAHINTGSNT